MESTETISQSPRRRASASAVSDFPDAVTPTSATAVKRSPPGSTRDAGAAPPPPRGGPKGGGDGRRSPSPGPARPPAVCLRRSRPGRGLAWPGGGGAAGQHRRGASADAFDQRLLAASDPSPMPGQGGAVDHGLESREPFGD